MKKLIFGIFLLGLVIAGIVVILSGVVPTGNTTDGVRIVISALSSGVLIFGLNFLGLDFNKRFFGGMSMVVSLAVLGYGIYVLVAKDTIIPVDPQIVPIVGGVSTGIGGMGVLTSTGVLAM